MQCKSSPVKSANSEVVKSGMLMLRSKFEPKGRSLYGPDCILSKGLATNEVLTVGGAGTILRGIAGIGVGWKGF